jgi:hypothetical protein
MGDPKLTSAENSQGVSFNRFQGKLEVFQQFHLDETQNARDQQVLGLQIGA